MSRLLSGLLLLALLAAPGLADAYMLRVAYQGNTTPPGVTVASMERVIQQALREWEIHSRGRIIARYDGIVSTHWSESDLIIIYWDDLGTVDCGRSCPWSQGVLCQGPAGNIRLNSNAAFRSRGTLNPLWSPRSSSSCGDVTATLIHEMAHLFRDTLSHFSNSVLDFTLPDIAARHLWEDDQVYIDNTRFPIGNTSFRLQTLDPVTNAVQGSADYSFPFAVQTPIAATVGDGVSASRNYALAWGSLSGNTRGIALYRGDTGNWNGNVLLSDPIAGSANFQRRTSRRPCVAVSSSGLDYHLVWTSVVQTPSGNGMLSGMRQLFAAESHDRGETWSSPVALPATTHNGLSCAVDVSRGRVVVTLAGVDERLWTIDRPTASGGAWGSAQPVLGTGFVSPAPTTRDIPQVAFDFFSGASQGRITWLENTTLETRFANFGWNGAAYEILSVPVNRVDPSGWTFSSRDKLRTEPVLSFEGQARFHGTTQYFNSGLVRAFTQWDLATGIAASHHVADTFAPATPFARATGAASSRGFLQLGVVSVLITPN